MPAVEMPSGSNGIMRSNEVIASLLAAPGGKPHSPALHMLVVRGSLRSDEKLGSDRITS